MARRNPTRLAEKLLTIRNSLGLSQRGLIRRLGLGEKLSQAEVSMFESGRRIPSLLVLREYALLANVWMDALVADELDLPSKLPASPKGEGVRRKGSNLKGDTVKG
jgi:transcriptional regulator with XRE-family HTH domain